MEEAGGGGGGSRRRLSLLEQMSSVDRSRDLAGLTLEAVLGFQKHPPPTAVSHTPTPVNRTFLDVIRDEQPRGGGGGGALFGNKDKKTWKTFREKLRLNRGGAAWTSSVPVQASDAPIQSENDLNSNNFDNPNRSLMFRGGSAGFTTVNSGDSTHSDESNDSAVSSFKPQTPRRSSSLYRLTNNTQQSDSSRSDNSFLNNTHTAGDETPARSLRPQLSRHNLSSHIGIPVVEREEESTQAESGRRLLSAVLAEERSLSAREAIAAAAATAAAEQQSPEEAIFPATGGTVEAEPVRMSLMDLLEETDQHMVLVGSMEDDVECDVEANQKKDDCKLNGGDGIEHTCCVCMVRHKGAAFIPCGHTFCRLCSREVWVQRGNCPLCNGNIMEILDIF